MSEQSEASTKLGLYESVRDVLSTDGLATKESSVETVQGLARSIKVSEGHVDFACGVFLDVDTLDGTILGLTFVFDILCEVFVPVGLGFPDAIESKGILGQHHVTGSNERRREERYVLRRVEHVLEQQRGRGRFWDACWSFLSGRPAVRNCR